MHERVDERSSSIELECNDGSVLTQVGGNAWPVRAGCRSCPLNALDRTVSTVDMQWTNSVVVSGLIRRLATVGRETGGSRMGRTWPSWRREVRAPLPMGKPIQWAGAGLEIVATGSSDPKGPNKSDRGRAQRRPGFRADDASFQTRTTPRKQQRAKATHRGAWPGSLAG